MTSDKQEKIRSRAYQIWEREGRPEGRGEEHWAQAAHEIENEEKAGADLSGGVKPTVSNDPTRPGGQSGSGSGSSGAERNAPPSSSGAGSGPAGSSGVASGLQPGGAKAAGGPATTQGAIGSGGGSTAGRATGSAPARKE
jgi:hypothetical protein